MILFLNNDLLALEQTWSLPLGDNSRVLVSKTSSDIIKQLCLENKFLIHELGLKRIEAPVSIIKFA